MTEDDLAEQVQDALATAHRQAARARRAAAEIEDMRGSGRSAGGEVSAVVDRRGLLQDVVLTRAAMGLNTAELAAAVLAAIADAGADLRVQVADVTRDLDIDPRPLREQTEAFDLADRLMRGA